MNLNMAILAEHLAVPSALSPSAKGVALTLSSACPLEAWGGTGGDEVAFVATEEEASRATELPRRLVVVLDADGEAGRLEGLCSSLEEGDREVLCVAHGRGVPGVLLCAAGLFARFQEWDERLVAAVTSGADAREVLSIGAEELANPIALFDSASVLVVHAGDLPEGWRESIWGAVIERGFVPMEHYSAEELRAFRQRSRLTREPIVTSPSKGHGESELTSLIEVGGSIFGMLAQVDLAGPFTAAQRSLVAHVRDRMEAMYRAQAGPRGHRDELAHCLRMILVGRPQDPSVTRFHLRSRGWSDSDAVRVVRVQLPVDMIETGRDQAQLSRVRITFPKAITLIHDETVVMACRDKDYPWDGLTAQLDRLSGEMGVAIAVSDAFPGIAHAGLAYRQCIRAHEVSRVGGLNGVVTFAGAAIPATLEAMAAQGLAEEFVDPRIVALADDAQGADLVRDLRTYLVCGCNAAKAAKRLFMHRNTLDYRIARIERAMGVELADVTEDEAIRMVLSCLLVEGRGR